MKLLLFFAALLALLGLLLMAIPGFQFSIILCFAFASVCALFYYFLKCPTALNMGILKVFCVLLAAGGIAAAITAGFILKAAHPVDTPDSDYIVVLGAAVHGTVPSLSLSERIQAAYEYLVANPDTIAILTGGQGRGEEITEAACMYRELTAMGIDGSRLLLEETSASTIENLRNALDIIEHTSGIRPKTLGIVSSEYHLFRAGLFAKELGLDAFGIPAKTSWITLRINYTLREIVAVWKYLVLGP